MGLMYSWATKEYLLWEMTIGQIVMYHNKGFAIMHPDNKEESNVRSFVDMPEDELRKLRDDMKNQYGDI